MKEPAFISSSAMNENNEMSCDIEDIMLSDTNFNASLFLNCSNWNSSMQWTNIESKSPDIMVDFDIEGQWDVKHVSISTSGPEIEVSILLHIVCAGYAFVDGRIWSSVSLILPNW